MTSSIPLLVLVLCIIPTSVLSATCTGALTTGWPLRGGANTCIIYDITETDIAAGAVNVNIPKFSEIVGDLKAFHFIGMDAEFIPLGTTVKSSQDGTTGVSSVTVSTTKIVLTSQVDSKQFANGASPSTGTFNGVDAGIFKTVSLKAPKQYEADDPDDPYVSINSKAFAYTDSSVDPLSTTPKNVEADVGSVDLWEQTDTNGVTAVGDIYQVTSNAGYAGSGTWALAATTVNSQTSTGTASGGATVLFTFISHLYLDGYVQYDYFVAGPTGDPQFAGFQGQNFQVHGIPDENFALISTPEFYMNAHFVYIASGKCDYNETECFSHPGTYIDQLVFRANGVDIKIVSGSHSSGLQVYQDGKLMKVGQRVSLPMENAYLHYKAANQAVVRIGQFTIGAINSDMFMNLRAACNDATMVSAGAKKVILSGDNAADNDKIVSLSYPEMQVHGLLGQTIRNIEYPHHKLIEGEPTDYQVSTINSSEFVFSQYTPTPSK